MTEFEKYLLNMLLHSAEDCCSVCAVCNKNGVCWNEHYGNETCMNGMRQWFEEHKLEEY